MSGGLSPDEAARLTGHIAGLTTAGLPLAPGLRATAEELPRSRLRSALEAIAASVERGATVEEAVAEQGGRLPDHLRGLVLIGARTGRMGQVLGKFVEFVSVGADLRRRLWLSMAYPMVSLVAAFAVFVFVCSAIVSAFENIFRDFGIPLPVLTIGLLRVAHLFNIDWPAVIEVLIALGVAVLLARFAVSPSTRRSLLAGIPVLGSVWRNTSLAEFCHLLGLLLECDVPLPEALRLSGDGVPDDSVRRACAGMAQDVEGGLSLSDAIDRRAYFPKGLGRVLRWAEGHQGLPGSLHMAGEMFEARARAQSGFTGTVVAVVTIIAILFGVGVIVIGLFLPLITLISRLSG